MDQRVLCRARVALLGAAITLLLGNADVTGAAKRPALGGGRLHDFAGQAYNLLTPGETGKLPIDANSTDQVALYDALTPLRGNVTAADVSRLYKSERFGVQGPVVRVERPRPGVTIQRDRFNVPHVYGRTRGDVMFAAGWAQVEDRGLLMEQGRGPARVGVLDVPGLSAFGLLTSLRQFVPSQQTEDYVHSQLAVLSGFGAKGRQVLRDLQEWVSGINAYYARNVQTAVRPAPWTLNDAVAAFSYIGSIFGNGGGQEVANADFLAGLQARFGPAPGLAIFRDLRESNDPSAPVSIPGRFPFQLEPAGATPGSAVIDAGSIDRSGQATVRAAAGSRRLASNALLVSARRSASGHPLAVMGPQLGYFYPEIVMEMDLHGGGIDARGAVAPVAPYILIGRGPDYAWSLTSATNDNTDQFLEQLCNPDGSPPTRASTSYLYGGRCTPMTRFEAGVLKGSGGQPDQSVSFWQTVHGPVGGTVTVQGRPYAFTTLRATRGREPAGELAMADLTTGRVHDPESFFRAANEFETTFNWHYVDSKHIAYFSSGRLPVRAPGTDPSLPTLGTGAYDWHGFLKLGQHPHAADPPSGLILNWNNKPAPGWGAADNSWGYGPVHRVQLFTGFKRRGERLAGVVSVMNRAATQDLRAVLVWPTVARVLAGGAAPSPLAQQAADAVGAWVAHGASRLAGSDGKIPDPGAAVLDSAFPGLARAVLGPVLGGLTDQFAALNKISNDANSSGSSYGDGWYGYVVKDLSTQLGGRPAAPYSRRYCGGGDLAACRAALWSALQAAATQLAAQQGPDPAGWRKDATPERITFKPGLISTTMRWTNRPTFQQAISFASHR